MEPLHIALCDDETAFRALLRPAVEEAFLHCGEEITVTEAASAGIVSEPIMPTRKRHMTTSRRKTAVFFSLCTKLIDSPNGNHREIL